MPNPDAEHWKTKYDRLCEILNEQTPLYEALKAENERLRDVLERIAHPYQLYGSGKGGQDLADALMHIASDGLHYSIGSPPPQPGDENV